jgi:hypothetical protein
VHIHAQSKENSFAFCTHRVLKQKIIALIFLAHAQKGQVFVRNGACAQEQKKRFASVRKNENMFFFACAPGRAETKKVFCGYAPGRDHI